MSPFVNQYAILYQEYMSTRFHRVVVFYNSAENRQYITK